MFLLFLTDYYYDYYDYHYCYDFITIVRSVIFLLCFHINDYCLFVSSLLLVLIIAISIVIFVHILFQGVIFFHLWLIFSGNWARGAWRWRHESQRWGKDVGDSWERIHIALRLIRLTKAKDAVVSLAFEFDPDPNNLDWLLSPSLIGDMSCGQAESCSFCRLEPWLRNMQLLRVCRRYNLVMHHFVPGSFPGWDEWPHLA